MNLKKSIADWKRFKEIITILGEEGFSFLTEKKAFGNISVKKSKKPLKSHEVRLRCALERLGPTFVKFGQMLSVRPDFVPKSYIHELEKLQDEVKPLAYTTIKQQFEKSTKQHIAKAFKSFDKKPIASASISQVHKAVLKTGEVVAVKIKRPEIEQIIDKDLTIMKVVASLLTKHIKALQKYNPVQVVEEFSEWTKREIDFRIEAENMQRFCDNFHKSKTTKIPKVYSYTREVIIMEFIDGTALHKVRKKNLKPFIENGFYSIMEQVFVHGLFHADPHSSNILILKDNKVGFVDFGIVGHFSEELKGKSCDLLLGISKGDENKVVEVLLDIGHIEQGANIDEFKQKIFDTIYLLKHSALKDIKISRTLEDILDTALENGVRIPKEFVLFGKMIVILEGVALLYYPNFHFVEKARPFMEEVVFQRYEPKKLITDSIKELLGLKKTIAKIPSQASRVLDKLERGNIKIEMKDTDVHRLSVEIDKSSNRLTYGMIIAALVISASLMIDLSNPFLFGISFFSFVLFSIAVAIGIILAISILNEKG